MSHYLLMLVLLVIGASCSLMPVALQSRSAQAVQQPTDQPSPQMMQRFEQKIAAHLLSEIPDVPTIRTSAQSNDLIGKLDKLVNHSGLDLDLVTRQQRNQLLALNDVYRALKFEQPYWPTKNHLADLTHLRHLVATKDQGAAISALIEALQENLQDQANRGILYPKPLQQAALSASRPLAENLQSNELVGYLNTIPTTPDVGPWIRARLKPFFNEQELVRALAQLETESNSIGARVYDTEIALNRELAAFYSDPRYDIRKEANPEQLTLDIVSLHVEEVLQFYRREQAVTILGVSADSSETIRIDDNTVLVYLAPITALPAFEFQSIAYQTAGELLSNAQWPFPWHRTLALAYGQWAAEQLAKAGYFSDEESKLAHLTQQWLFVQLGIVEAKLALGQWSYLDAKVHLQNKTPYTAVQVERWLMQMLAEDGSYAAAALATKAFSMQSKALVNVINQEMARQLPLSVSDLLNRPEMKKVSAATDLIDS
jgi:hypothetical protein